jgi:hypothetical protein
MWGWGSWVEKDGEHVENDRLKGASTTSSDPIGVVQAILADSSSLLLVSGLVADDATYLSLNYENPT